MAVMSILIYARLFKYCAESKSIQHLYTVLYKSLAEIIPFFSKSLKLIFGFFLILPNPPFAHAHILLSRQRTEAATTPHFHLHIPFLLCHEFRFRLFTPVRSQPPSFSPHSRSLSLVLFCIVYIGFSLAFYSCFGLRVYEYRNLEATLRSNLAILAGDATFYPDLLEANRFSFIHFCIFSQERHIFPPLLQ